MTFSYQNASCDTAKIQKSTFKKVAFYTCTAHLCERYITPSFFVSYQYSFMLDSIIASIQGITSMHFVHVHVCVSSPL